MQDRPLVLAIETSSRIGSVALETEHKLISDRTFSAPMRHGAELLPAVQDLLQQIDAGPESIGQVYVSLGPGSFTGLRIAASLAKAMHFATGVKIVIVDTLDVIAANAQSGAPSCPAAIAAVLDAKRNQFFMAGYRRSQTDAAAGPGVPGTWTKVMEDCVITAQTFMDEYVSVHSPVGLLGDGLVYHQDKFSHPDIIILDESLWSPKAASVYQLGLKKAQQGQFTDPLELSPRYLRAPQVTLKRRP